MQDPKRRSSNALPLRRGSAQQNLRGVKLECDHLREKLQRMIIDNPQAARKAALLVSLWIEGKTKSRGLKKAG